MPRLRALLIWVFAALLVGGAVRAELADDVAELLRRGRYDEVVAVASQALPPDQPSDPRFMYMRGVAAFYIQRFELAEHDLRSLGEYVPWEGWEPAARFAERLTQIDALAPPHTGRVLKGETCLFELHWEQDGPWPQAVVSALEEAHAHVADFYGFELTNTAVFIFETQAPYEAFYAAISGSTPTDWQWGAGACGALLFCRQDEHGAELAPAGSDYMRSSIAHEFSHCVVQRRLGTLRLPPWLHEGLAMCCGARMTPADMARNEADIARLEQEDRLLPLTVLQDDRAFYAEDNCRAAYAQSFALARRLVVRVGPDGLRRLLPLLRGDGDVDRVLQAQWQFTSADLYGERGPVTRSR